MPRTPKVVCPRGHPMKAGTGGWYHYRQMDRSRAGPCWYDDKGCLPLFADRLPVEVA